MNALLAVSGLTAVIIITLLITPHGAPALVVGGAAAALALLVVSRAEVDKEFLLRIFVMGLLMRVLVGSGIFFLGLQEFFGGDAFTYHDLGIMQAQVWSGEMYDYIFRASLGPFISRNYGMVYVVAAVYTLVGENMLAVQFLSAVFGAATAPLAYLCAHQLFGNTRVSRISACFAAFFPSMVLWSSQGLKDGPMVFLLALGMYATLKLGERLNIKFFAVLVGALVAILTLRFYVFYMMIAAIVGAFVIGRGKVSTGSIVRQSVLLAGVGLAMVQLGVLRSAGSQFEVYGNLEAVQRSRADLATSAQSGFGKDVDVSTTEGALTAIPVGMVYLLFAPFPWQLASLRQLITLPEMILWWASFPFLVTGLWFTLKHRLRRALPILIFTTMLTLAYSVFQGNVGTAYRQRSQLLIFYFIFVAVGFVLFKEKREERERQIENARGQNSLVRDRRAGVVTPLSPALGHIAAAPPADGVAAAARGGGE